MDKYKLSDSMIAMLESNKLINFDAAIRDAYRRQKVRSVGLLIPNPTRLWGPSDI